MHILVIGAGAIGSALAAGLLLAGRDVTLIARGKRLADLTAHPLELDCDGAVLRASVPVSNWEELTRTSDLVFLCVKTGDLADALDCLAPLLVPGATVVTLQNGVDAHACAADSLPSANIVAGRVHGFFEMDGSRVRHVGVASSILFGCTHGNAGHAHAAVMEALSDSGFDAERANDIIRALWEKLLIAACAGGVAAAFDIPAGQILHHSAAHTMFDQATQEVVILANARGVALDETDVQRVTMVMTQFPPHATTSLQRDLSSGRVSEYDALIGAVLRMACTQSVPHPVFAAIDRAVRNRFSIPLD